MIDDQENLCNRTQGEELSVRWDLNLQTYAKTNIVKSGLLNSKYGNKKNLWTISSESYVQLLFYVS